jgi:hypothetical protein
LSRVPAGLWPFPTLSLPSVCGCVDLYPAVFVRCTCPSLPQRQRPHVTGNTFGTRDNPCKAISTGSRISGLQSFAHVHAPTLARPPDRSHRSRSTGRLGRLHHAWPEGLPTSGCGIATCLHGHLTRLDFHQLDGSLVGCSSLHAAQALLTLLAERGRATANTWLWPNLHHTRLEPRHRHPVGECTSQCRHCRHLPSLLTRLAKLSGEARPDGR